ncbi:beta-galactosidase small subunit-related protein [Anaeromassilibacillus senegalensis]|uniref:glycoside hydrolase family 2 TIM barrel-domain containing protein n=1 Tax=Anaeromassilibacillus senegalensis TaxID=1673717 RepID=UPI00067FAE79|nr:glycoside hydrolase family 2 TIM barrel-domain containing protein [Anaeromassilibacillus senegalensis]
MKSKKLISILLAAVMTVSVGIQPAFAAGNGSDGGTWKDGAAWPQLTRAASAMAPDTQKFANPRMEYTGRNYTDPITQETVRACDIFGINREPAHATGTIPYESVEKAVVGAVDYKKEDSNYVQMLSGIGQEDWELVVVSNAEKGQKYLDDGFMNPDYEATKEDGWQVVDVPRSWTRYEGFGDWDYSIYTNTQMPWQGENVSQPNAPVQYNPVGFYRRDFVVDDTLLQDNGRVLISFQGVESAYYVYVNGKEVGYSEDSYRPHDFDITDYLNPQGQVNTLAVEVHKFSDGTWMEDQDMIYDGGIFRDVYLYSTPLVHINDYRVITDLDETYTNAQLELSTSVKNYSEQAIANYAIDVQLFDADGSDVFANDPMRFNVSDIAVGGEVTMDASKLVESPDLWSAEDPNLYTLVMTLYDKTTGRHFESISQQLGFREIEFTRTEVDDNYNRTTNSFSPITINGQPILFKGTNRHDSDPIYGKYVPNSVYEEDVKIMKQWNLNAIRTSHYANDEYLYYLCDKYGLYMMGETNAECHAIMGQNDNINNYYGKLYMDRTVTAYQTLKNNTAVVAWSIGNEMSYDRHGGDNIFPKMVWYFKDHDKTRPVHAEGLNQDCGTDMGSNMYPTVGTVWGYAGKGKMPYVMCEYDHAMGNAVGNMKEYWDAIRSSDNMVGGFIWDWVDQSRYIDLDSLPAQSSITEMSSLGAEGTAHGPTELIDAAAESLTGKSYSGYTVLDDANNSVYNAALSGEGKSFTFEVMVKPNSTARNSVLIAKGDTQVALKTQSNGDGLEFFVYNGGWHSATCNLPSDWVGNWHQVAGTYDGNTLRLYIDGELKGSTNGKYDIRPNSYPLGIGRDEENNRSVDGEISIGRVYTKALTADELKAQMSATPDIGPSDESVLVWLDYSAGLTKQEGAYWDYYAEDYAKQHLYDEEMDGRFFGYGGDWGDKNNSGNFCVNGLVSPDRDPQPELYEVKYQYQNYWMTASDNEIANRKINVYNESNFTNLNEYDVKWELLEDGKVIDEGVLTDVDVAPKQTETVVIPFTMPAEADRPAGAEYYLNINVLLKEDTLWAEAGHEIAHEQFAIPASVTAIAPITVNTNVTVDTENDADYVLVSGDNFSFKLDKTSGAMSEYVYNGETVILDGPAPNFWRAKINNDGGDVDNNWKNANKNITVDENGITVAKAEDGRTVITTNLTLTNANNAKETVVYTIDGSGAVTMNFTLDATGTSMGQIMKVGSNMVLPEGYEDITRYGNGPTECYFDRDSYAMTGLYTNTVTDSFYPYLETQETGTQNGTKWMTLTGENKATGILVAGKQDLETSALHFSIDQLDAAKHPYQLKAPNKETYVNIDLISRGIGNRSCGPDTLEEYKIPNNKAYSFEYTIVPFDAATADPMELSKPYRAFASFDQDAFDKQQAEAVQNAIDSIYVFDYAQKAELENILESYENLTAAQKALVTNYADLEEAMEKVMTFKGKAPENVADLSNNQINPVLGDNAKLVMDGKFNVGLTGWMAIPNDKGTDGADVFDELFVGKNEFTVETWVKPASSPRDYDMFMGKGDNCFGFRTRGGTIDFFIKAGDGNWKSIEAKVSDSQVRNKWIHVAGIFDGNKLSVYLDGEIIAELVDNSGLGVKASSTKFHIGYDPETNRTNSNTFANTRVYNKALTAEELNGQGAYDVGEAEQPAIAPDSENVVMWLDFSDISYKDVPVVDDDAVAISPKDAQIISGSSKEFTIVKAAPTAQAKAAGAYAMATIDDLKALLQQAGTIDTSIYTASSVAIFEAAINVASTVLDFPVEAPESVVEAAYNMLKAAMEGLVWDNTYEVTEAEWSIVDSFGREIEGATITPNAEDAGKATVAVTEAVPVGTRIRVMATNINGVEGLSAKTYATVVAAPEKTPREKLEALYAEATAIKNAGQGDYTDDSWNAFEGAYAAAGTVLGNAEATDAELMNALDVLQAAIDGLDNYVAAPHDLRVEYGPKVALTVDGVSQELADITGTYIQKDVMAEDTVSLTFSHKDDDREFVTTVLTVNGVEKEVTFKDGDRTVAYYELTMPNENTTVKFTSVVVWKALLRNAIASAEEAMETEAYGNLIPWAKDKFDAAYKAAVKVEADETALQDEVDAATIAMTGAMNYLSFEKGDKTKLELLFKTYEPLKEEDFTAASWAKYAEALAAAHEVYEDENALVKDVDDAAKALTDAFEALETPADKSELEARIEEAKSYDLSKYTPASQEGFEDLIKEAETLLAKEEPTQTELDKMVNRLVLAIANLRLIPDKSYLEELVDGDKDINEDEYTPASYAAYKAAYTVALAVLNDPNATEKEVNGAANTLETRRNGLVRKAEDKPNTDNGNTGSNTNKGSSSSSNSAKAGNSYGNEGTAVVGAAQAILGKATVVSDTTVDFNLKRGSAYCFKMTVVNGNNLVPSFTVGNGSVLKTQFVAKIGNDYYYRVYAVGTPGQSTGVYTTLAGQNAQQHCTVTVG